MNGSQAFGAIGALISLIAFVVTFGFMFVVFLFLVFINSNTKDIRQQLMTLNEQVAAIRRDRAVVMKMENVQLPREQRSIVDDEGL